jgi:hypothetical protein
MKIHTPGTVMMSQKRLSYWAQKNKTWKSWILHLPEEYENNVLVISRWSIWLTMLSTFCSLQTQMVSGIRKKELLHSEKPAAVLEYTRFMSGLDTANQICACYGF